MWIFFGILSVILTVINLYMYSKGKNYTLFTALALSCTALTGCAEYAMIAAWSKAADAAAIFDVAPGMSNILWIFTAVMIILNILPVFADKGK